MIFLVPDFREDLAKVDKLVVDLNQEIDQLIVEKNIDVEEAPSRWEMQDGYGAEIIEELVLNLILLRWFIIASN